ncbi:MAG TPA: uroporphyrinogen decarboxylase family protein [Armatimonadota bacterium]|jgi:hypothetical protein
MNERQRIETVFAGGRPDRMVWYGDLGYYHAAHETIGDLPERWAGTAGRSRMHQELGVGEYVPGCCAFAQEEGPEVSVEDTRQDGVLVRRWVTPVGTLTERSEYSPMSYSWGHREYPVKTPADLAIVRFIVSQRRYTPIPETVAQMDRDLAAHGLPVIAVGASPMADLYKHWVGVVQLSYLLADARAEVEETLAVSAAAQEPMWRITAESPCRYVMLTDNMTAEGAGGLFERYYRDFLTEKLAAFHAAGQKVICHVDGTLRGLVERLPGIGVDCLDAVTPKPVGDVGMDEIRDLVGPDILILGGLPGAMFAPPFTPEMIERHVREIIRLHKDSGTFMFGVADQVPPNGNLELVRLVTRLVEEAGYY